ncbi:hypothetical protein ACGIF2_03090 [Cellulomonas sp. P22]|uniref:hypothetical protein n=1 Tax=Cellulomonas sp. P22 TaxID=3373189 RepID=UPI0037AB35BF
MTWTRGTVDVVGNRVSGVRLRPFWDDRGVPPLLTVLSSSVPASWTVAVPVATTSGSAGWLAWAVLLGPAATLCAGVVAGVVAFLALGQRRRADATAEWWRRTQWALGEALSDDPSRRRVGTAVLYRLAQSDLATDEDLAVFDAAWAVLLGGVRPLAAATGPTQAEVTAARGQVLTDRRRGLSSPAWVEAVARGVDE